MLAINNIYKSFGDTEVLKGVSLEIGTREIVTILGPSGAGKTTLLRIIMGLEKPDRGEVLYDAMPVTGMKDKQLSAFRNSNIGFVFQFHQLLAEFNACENVALPAMIGGMSKRKAMERASELLELLGLTDRLSHKPAQMSGGERQRVAVARALVNNPKVVFADEPTGSLDSRNRDEIQALFAKLREELGQTFVIVTHDPTLSSIADRTVYMADGHITSIQATTPEPGDDIPAAPED